ncbi:hypothetical protein GCM10007981_19110 [Thermocladium modestius]|uniref:Uncharacterized protein n=1 Tax=Thermocladium modestius TaxID=62609 RepID=A0A830GW64_9CREN|nr:hypothetical protein GCM10007981_19110 [Thermocladium modestius]
MAALVHVELSQMFYYRVYPLANATHNNETLMLLSQAENLTETAKELINESQCFTALKDAIEAIHLEQKAFVQLVHEKHLNRATGLLAQAEAEQREASVLLREATAFNATEAVGNLTRIMGELSNITSYLSTGNSSSLNASSIRAELITIRAQLNSIRTSIIEVKKLQAAAARAMLRSSMYINSTSIFYNTTGNAFGAYKRIEHIYNALYRSYIVLLNHGYNDTQLYQLIQQLQQLLGSGPQGIRSGGLSKISHSIHSHGPHGSGNGKGHKH